MGTSSAATPASLALESSMRKWQGMCVAGQLLRIYLIALVIAMGYSSQLTHVSHDHLVLQFLPQMRTCSRGDCSHIGRQSLTTALYPRTSNHGNMAHLVQLVRNILGQLQRRSRDVLAQVSHRGCARNQQHVG
ncbi:hypothetical protein BDD14_3186 [Edaphobacter modestus]|uniref:Uncharacterized protein n=1 Tax=Edaphobacter modestus TaxID=388466 RepID=A0A4Q7YVG3_9BACT|nr:hypothetical protein BDD14_3186 [Edaphobacter modestus]